MSHAASPPASSSLLRGGAAWPRFAVAGALGWGLLALHGVASAGTCEARSGAVAPRVVELYTSEGCSSCPPADRWLSNLKQREDLLPLAFHVTYWDRLGWADRFAQPAFTERQRALMVPSGARHVYTPQVLVDGQDWRGWPGLPRASAAPPVDLQLARRGDVVSARIAAMVLAEGTGKATPGSLSDASRSSGRLRFSGYWVVLEDNHRSDVRAGENAGEKLRHDHVVRHYQPVPAWPAEREQLLQWRPPTPDADATRLESAPLRRRVAFVVIDAANQRPVQALVLAC